MSARTSIHLCTLFWPQLYDQWSLLPSQVGILIWPIPLGLVGKLEIKVP